jgi:Viral BACON domain
MLTSNSNRIFRWLSLFAMGIALAGCGGGGGTGSALPSGTISVSTNSLSYATIKDINNQIKQTVSVTVSGKDIAQIGAIFPPGTPEAPWINNVEFIQPPAQVYNRDMVITVDGSNLSAGTYTTTLRVAIARQDFSIIAYQDIQITYKVEIKLAMVQTELLLEYMAGTGQLVNPTTVEIVGDGIPWTVSADQAWLKLDRTSGMGRQKIIASVDQAGIEPGIYIGNITLTNTTTLEKTVIKVTLKCVARIVFSKPRLDFSGSFGAQGVSSNIDNSVFVTDMATPSSKLTVKSDQPWAKIILFYMGNANADFTVSPELTGLAVGKYTSVITVTDPVNGYSVPFTVTLTITPSTLSLPITRIEAGAVLDSVTQQGDIDIFSTGAPVYWTASVSQSWIKLANSNGVTPSKLTVSVDSAGLAFNSTHSGVITLTDPALNQSVDISITAKVIAPVFQVTGGASPDMIFISGRPETGIVTPKTVDIFLNNGEVGNWTAKPLANWLSLDKTSGITPGKITLSVDTSKVQPGGYSTSILVEGSYKGINITNTMIVTFCYYPNSGCLSY